jgi:hypothetical protein
VRVIDRLSPFWAVVVTLVGLTVPQSLLALPIAASGVGTAGAVAVLAVIGVLMSLSIAAEMEALARDRDFRTTGAFYGRLVSHYLGARAASVPAALAALRTGMSVLAGYIGLCVTLASLTGVPRGVWGVLTIVLLAVVLVRGGVRTPAAVGALIGLACLPLLAIIAVVALAHGHLGNLSSPSTVRASAFGDLLGLVLILYLGSVYVVQVARDRLSSDPGGRGLIAGSAVATMVTTGIAAGWLVAVASALPSSQLAGETGTVLGPLGERFGAVVVVPSVVLSLLLLGLGTERAAVVLMDLVHERLPERRLAPVLAPIVICVLGEVLLDLGEVSFSGVFNAAGIVANVVLGLVVPLLLLAVSRRTGELAPGLRVPLLGRRPIRIGLLVCDALLLLALATVLGNSGTERVAAVIALAAMAAVLWLSRGRLRGRAA